MTTERWTLAPDLRIFPVTELADADRAEIDCDDGDFTLTLPHSRTSSIVVDSLTAELLRRFEKPRSLTDAIVLYALPRGLDPLELTAAVVPSVERCVRAGFMIDADTPEDSSATGPTLKAGERFQDWTVLRIVKQMQDVEVYQVRIGEGDGHRIAAVKLQRDAGREPLGSFRQEAAVLKLLAGRGAPGLLRRRGKLEGRDYLLMEWCPGVDARGAAAEWHRRSGSGRGRLLELVVRVAGAYAGLHERGVLHGDVHPANLLVDAAGEVRLIDFGLAHLLDAEQRAERRGGGVAFFMAPEEARAQLKSRRARPVCDRSEQYSVAALIYLLVTGQYTHDFRLQRSELLRQLVEEPPRRFSECVVEPWVEMETVLRRALAKEPGSRFGSMKEFAEALASLTCPRVEPGSPPRGDDPLLSAAERCIRDAGRDGPWLEAAWPGPTASVTYGAAGVAYALLRLAGQRQDPKLLALADRWGRRARSESNRPAAFVSTELGVDDRLVGEVSPYHTASGVCAVEAMIARVRNDWMSFVERTLAFVEASRGQTKGLDLTLGESSTLLFSALLVDGAPLREPRLDHLHKLGDRTLTELWRQLESRPTISDADPLGIAHGWAGMLYASLQWSRVRSVAPAPGVARRLYELATLARPNGRGVLWPWHADTAGWHKSMPGWCNGSAGYVFLWTLAWKLFEKPRFLDLARGAAWHAWEMRSRNACLCCGLIGQAYALLNLYRHTGDRLWRARARDLGQLAAAEGQFADEFPHSLFRGDLALAVLAGDLERPEQACLPLFEEEGWAAAWPVLESTQQSVEARNAA